MRKILFGVLILILFICAGFTIVKGINLFSLSVSGVKQINEKNDEIDKKNSELDGLIEVTYPQSLAKLEQTATTLKNTKTNYEELALSARNKSYLQTDKYEIEFLWTKLGNYAKDEKVQIRIVVSNSSVSGLFDLKFYIAGKYLKVKDFIYDLENDSKLGFKVEDFNMVSVGNDDVQGSFNCKEININLEKIDEGSQESENGENSENNDSNNNNNDNNNNNQEQNATNNTTITDTTTPAQSTNSNTSTETAGTDDLNSTH